MNEDILDSIPNHHQRQDDVTSQLSDLIMVANKLGMFDAADAITQMFKSSKPAQIKYGCHCDIESTVSGLPDDCVIDSGDYHDCIYAHLGMRKEQCEYWRPLK